MSIENTTTISGAIQRVIHSQANFVVAKLENGAVIVGNMLAPQVGLQYELSGRWEVHPKFGKQFAFVDYETHYPTGQEAIESYLVENAKWIGKTTAKVLVQAYGDKTLEICKADPDRVAREIRGLTSHKAYEIAAMLRMNEENEKLRLELKTILGGTKVNERSIKKIIEKYGKDAPGKIKDNPYALIDEIDGIGFLTADQVAQKIGYAFDGQPRIRAGIVHVLKEAAHNDGHTRLPRNVLLIKAKELLTLGSTLIDTQIEPMVKNKMLALTGDHVALKHLYDCEAYISKKLKILANRKLPEGQAIIDGLAEDQVEALNQTIRNSVFILTGSPGTGKGYTISRIIKSFPQAKIALAAPTGKAAKRIESQTGHAATTIHRLLEPLVDNGKFYFSRGEEHPLEENVVIIDECSMVDVPLFKSLLLAIAPGTRLVLVGDPNQLPSVGPGLVLLDMINSGVIPFVKLTKIKRQSPGMLLQQIHAIRDGKIIESKNGDSDDFFFIDKDDPAEIRQTILGLITKRLPKAYKFDPKIDIQTLSMMNDKTDLAVEKLNDLVEQALNPKPRIGKTKYAIGTKVLQTKNDYEKDVVNGDEGFIVDYDNKEKMLTVEFLSPSRFVQVGMQENNIRMGWVKTIHRCQGSEYPAVVIPVHKCFSRMLSRNLIYTALSRATKICVLVGQREAFRKAIKTDNPIRRNTALKEMLQGEGFPE